MKYRIATLFASLSLATLCTVQAQTPTPSPSATPVPVGWKALHDGFPAADRIADAQAFVALSSTSPADAATAAANAESLTLGMATASNWNTASSWTVPGTAGPIAYNQLAAALISTKGHTPSTLPPIQASNLFSQSINTSANLAGSNAAGVAFLKALQPNLSAADFPLDPAWANDPYSGYAGFFNNLAAKELAAADEARNAGNYNDALSYLSDPILTGAQAWVSAIIATANIKALSKSADALSWAKLAYMVLPYNQTKTGLNAIRFALVTQDKNLVRVNAFFAAQNNSSLPNVLTGIPLPDSYKSGLPHPEFDPALDAVIKGNNVLALQYTMTAYLGANDNTSLSAAVDGVAKALRNVDLNLVRANGFSAAQVPPVKDFPITELQ